MDSLFSIPISNSESKAAAVSAVDLFEQYLCTYEQILVNIISSANDARNSSDPDILMSLSEDLEWQRMIF